MKGVLFLDIQCVSAAADHEALSSVWQELWARKARQWPEEAPEENYSLRASRLAEFGQIVAISMGALQSDAKQSPHLRIKSFFERDEAALLTQMNQVLASRALANYVCCAHNGKAFHFPYLCRRLLVHGLPIPTRWRLKGKRPWQVEGILDTMDDWVFGDFKRPTPLRLLGLSLGLPEADSAEWVSEEEVHTCYYGNGDESVIVAQSKRQLQLNAQLYLRLRGEAVLSKAQITQANDE